MKNQSKMYFGEEMQEKVRKMSEKEMYSVLLDLQSTHYWVAVLKYGQMRASYAQDGLLTTDPTKEAGKVAQFQGILMGISDLPELIIQLKASADKKSKGKAKEVDESPVNDEENDE